MSLCWRKHHWRLHHEVKSKHQEQKMFNLLPLGIEHLDMREQELRDKR